MNVLHQARPRLESSAKERLQISLRDDAREPRVLFLVASTTPSFPTHPQHASTALCSNMKILSIQILSVVPHNPDIPAAAVAAASDLSSFTFYQRGRYAQPFHCPPVRADSVRGTRMSRPTWRVSGLRLVAQARQRPLSQEASGGSGDATRQCRLVHRAASGTSWAQHSRSIGGCGWTFVGAARRQRAARRESLRGLPCFWRSRQRTVMHPSALSSEHWRLFCDRDPRAAR